MEGPDGWHDIWDVLGGATVSIGSTYLFTKPYKMQVGFISNKGDYLVSFKYQF